MPVGCIAGFPLQVGVWIEAGSRHETPTNNGVARLLERLAFKVMLVTLCCWPVLSSPHIEHQTSENKVK